MTRAGRIQMKSGLPTLPTGSRVISNFIKLRRLTLDEAYLNGRYPVLFSSIIYCKYLKWDLGMFAGLPLLKELYCANNSSLTGRISSLRVLKDTLEKVSIIGCKNVEGNFMDLADFPHLKKLDLYKTAVKGDIRDISHTDFPSLERLILPKGVLWR